MRFIKSADMGDRILMLIKKQVRLVKETEQIEQLLADPWAVDIQAIWEQALHNPDPDKRKLFDALHTYVLDKRQEEIINEKKFVI